MQIIRAPSIYDQREAERKAAGRMRRRFWPVWLIGGIAAIAAVTAAFARSVGIGAWVDGGCVAASWAVIVPLVTALGWAGSQSQGEAGEAAALKAIAMLGDDWSAVVNVKIPQYERIGDVDLLVTGPPGVVAIEVKNLHGPWRVDGDHWVRITDTGLRRGVGGQLKNQVKAVTSFLGRSGTPCLVSGLIAVNSNAEIEIASPGPYPIVPYDRLAAVLDALRPLAPVADTAKARETLCFIATAS